MEIEERLPIGRLLSAATRMTIQEMHSRLAERGHPGLRPAYGYALVAIGDGGLNTAQLAGAMGMTKQGAAKLVVALEEQGYVERRAHEADGRARLLTLSARGRDLLEKSAAVQREIEDEWAALLGERPMRSLRRGLERVVEEHAPDARAAVALRPIW
jgi:DNA-binding MarR family transcriptional regulator